jgi:cysteine desulfurase
MYSADTEQLWQAVPGAARAGLDLSTHHWRRKGGSKVELYFDTAATTPLLPEVRAAMQEAMDVYGNPSSLHRKGIEAEERLQQARTAVARCLGVEGGRIVFTGGGSEANNLAIFGTVRRFANRGRHLVTTQIEHPSVLEAFRALERRGWRVTYVAPDPDGTVPAERVLDAVTDETVLVSMMHVNNETGAIQPVEAVGEALKARPTTLFHVDGIQAFGKIPHCAAGTGADLYTVSGHKIGAPKGVGALYIRPGLEIEPLVYGGGQEFGLRSGTENVLGIHALGVAADIAARGAEAAWQRVEALSRRLTDGIGDLPGIVLRRPRKPSPYIVGVSFPGLRGEVIVHAFEQEGLFVSTGSACSTRGGHARGSHVLKAMGWTEEERTGSVRLSIARWHTETDVDQAVAIIRRQITWLREMLGAPPQRRR